MTPENQIPINDPEKGFVENKKLDITQNLLHYRKVLEFMGANVPVSVLCLPTKVEKILLKNEIRRVYDLVGLDLTKIEGLGDKYIGLLHSRLDIFIGIDL